MTLVDYLLDNYGIKEIPGEKHHPKILEFFRSTAAWIKDDETPWCSATVNHGARKCGLEHTNRANARSWLYVGEEVDEPVRGNDVAIFWRKGRNSPFGHVGAWICEHGLWVWVLSGNQNNQLNISPYPKSRLLQVRRLRRVHCA